MNFDELLSQLRKNAASVDKIAIKLGVDLSAHFKPEVIKLNNCLDTYSAFKVLVSTVVKDVSGDMGLSSWASVTSNFDKNWDAFAKEYNEIFNGLNNTQQKNVLEVFARTHFGDNVFSAGSVIKNETPNILNGILGFQQGLSSFKGSYRNPVEAANKIRNGVNAIVKSTESIANSANNVVKTLRGFRNADPQGSVILDKLGKLSTTKPISFATKTINNATGVINIAGNLGAGFGNASNALDSLKKGDIQGAAAAAKASYGNLKNVKSEIDAMRGKGPVPTQSGLPTSGKPGIQTTKSANLNQNPTESPNSQQEQENDSKSDSYVCSKAKIKCSCGDKISTLTVFPDRTIWLTGEPQANISDHISMQNIAPFGKCHTTRYPATGSATAANHGKLTPMPCVPNTPYPWMGGKDDVILKGQPALLKSSKCKCVWGGTITITDDGQVDGTYSELPEERLLTQEELDEEANVGLSAEDLLDGLQMALDAAGMFPGLGAIPDLLNACISACRGDWANAGLCLFAAIPGIGDAAGAAKLMKNGAKIAQKSKKAQKVTSEQLRRRRAEMAGLNPDAPHQSEILYDSIFDARRVNPVQPVRKPTSSTYQNPQSGANKNWSIFDEARKRLNQNTSK